MKHVAFPEAVFFETGRHGNCEAGFAYCIHCERAYPVGWVRLLPVRGRFSFHMCPYTGCNGDTVMDAWSWESVRTDRTPEYPIQPELGKVYPLND